MQDNHDGGGRCCIVLAVKFGGKKMNKKNLSWLKAATNRQLNTTTNQIHTGAAGEGYERTRDWWGVQVQGELYLIVLGAIKFG